MPISAFEMVFNLHWQCVMTKMETHDDAGPPNRGSERIMLVEDEGFVRNVTVAVLESAGYSVVAVTNAREASEQYDKRSGRLDLLLTDIALPGEDGRRLAKRLSEIDPALRILLVTGCVEDGERSQVGEDGAFILQKPFGASTLLHSVRQLLDKNAAGRKGELGSGQTQASLR